MYHFYYKHETQKYLQDLSVAKPLTVRRVNFKQSIRNNGRSCNATPSIQIAQGCCNILHIEICSKNQQQPR